MDCEICKNKIAETFLKKILGTAIKKDGKKHYICSQCQAKFTSKEDMLKNI